jgi:hypothetical protein
VECNGGNEGVVVAAAAVVVVGFHRRDAQSAKALFEVLREQEQLIAELREWTVNNFCSQHEAKVLPSSDEKPQLMADATWMRVEASQKAMTQEEIPMEVKLEDEQMLFEKKQSEEAETLEMIKKWKTKLLKNSSQRSTKMMEVQIVKEFHWKEGVAVKVLAWGARVLKEEQGARMSPIFSSWSEFLQFHCALPRPPR